MNIFFLSWSPFYAAVLQCDKHVVKMTIETAQLLSSALHILGCDSIYRPTHLHHPTTKWVADSPDNFMWAVEHGLTLGEEYIRRYGRLHKSVDVIRQAGDKVRGWSCYATPPPKCMPDHIRDAYPGDDWDSVVRAYRAYYAEKAKKITPFNRKGKPYDFTLR